MRRVNAICDWCEDEVDIDEDAEFDDDNDPVEGPIASWIEVIEVVDGESVSRDFCGRPCMLAYYEEE